MSPNILKSNLGASVNSLLNKLHIAGVIDYSRIAELFRGINHQYILFWENGRPFLYDYKTSNDKAGLSSISERAGGRFLKDQVTVYLSGPQVYQRIFEITAADDELPEWIVSNRHQIWPAGVDDETLEFSYTVIKTNDKRYLYFCFISRQTLLDIESYCEEQNLTPSIIIPRASLLLNNGSLSNSGSFTDLSLKRGELNESIARENGHFRIYPSHGDNEPIDWPLYQNNGASDDPGKSASLDIENYSFIAEMNLSAQKITRLSIPRLSKIFKGSIYSLLILLIILIAGNIYLSIRESQYGSVLAEIEILSSNTKLAEQNISSIESELDVYASLFSGRTSHGELIVDISKLRPENLWLRHLEIKDSFTYGNSVILKGYAVDRSCVSEYVSALESLPQVKAASITSLSHQTENLPADLPSRFQNQLYRYSINIEVAR